MTNGPAPSSEKPQKDPAASARTSAVAAVVAAVFAGISAISAVPTLLAYFHVEISKPISYDVTVEPKSNELTYIKDGDDKFSVDHRASIRIRNKSDKPITVHFSASSPIYELKRGNDGFPQDGLNVEPYKAESFEVRISQPLDFATNLALDNLLQKNNNDLSELKMYLRRNHIDFLTMRKGYSDTNISRCFKSGEEAERIIYKKPRGDDKLFGISFDLSVEGVDKSDIKSCYTGAVSSEPG